MYDPSIGRWLQEDPEGFVAGDSNLYRYVSNNPANANDPSGLVFSWATTFIGAGIGAVVSTGSYLVVSGIRGQPITWGGVAGAATGGAISGGTMGAAVGVFGGDPSALIAIGLGGVAAGGVGGAAGGGAGSIVQQQIDDGQINWQNVRTSAAWGGGIGSVSGGVGSYFTWRPTYNLGGAGEVPGAINVSHPDWVPHPPPPSILTQSGQLPIR